MATPTTSTVGLQLYKTLLTPNTASTHLMLFSTLFGSHLWHGFIGGPVTFKTVPRQTFGLMQSKIFPFYFALGTIIPTALIGNLALAQGGFSNLPTFPVVTLAISAVANAVNWLFLGPKATEIMFERHRLEREEGVDAYKDKDKVSEEESAADVWLPAGIANRPSAPILPIGISQNATALQDIRKASRRLFAAQPCIFRVSFPPRLGEWSVLLNARSSSCCCCHRRHRRRRTRPRRVGHQ